MKKETVHIETPEKILFSYTIADTGQRIAAYIIDFLIQLLSVIILFLLFYFFKKSIDAVSFIWDGTEPPSEIIFFAFMFLLYFFIQWGYFIFFEVLWDGQSPGKKIVKIRVIKTDGDFMDFSTIVLRNLLRAVDGFPFFHLIGGMVSIIDKRSRRVGDFIAGTLLVEDIKYNYKEPDFSTKLSDESTALNSLTFKRRLNEEELYVIRRFLNEKYKLVPHKLTAVADQLAGDVHKRLYGVEEPVQNPVLFLEGVYKAHSYDDTK